MGNITLSSSTISMSLVISVGCVKDVATLDSLNNNVGSWLICPFQSWNMA